MPESPERAALENLYDTREPEGLPAFLEELYPKCLPSLLYMGTAGSCTNGGPGVFYGNWDFEEMEKVRVIEWGTPITPIPTALYRCRDQFGTLLYVGITENLERRWKDHAKDKPWWPKVQTRSIEWFPTRDHALAAEADAIRAEHPRYNVNHNGRGARRRSDA